MSITDDMHAHAIEAYPLECCGLVVRTAAGDTYMRCRNLADMPGEHFQMDHRDYARAEEAGEILAVVHSHPDASQAASEADRVLCEAAGLPYLIFAVWCDEPGKPYVVGQSQIEPSGYSAPLEGREFFHGVLDCWTLVRDWYVREWGVTLPNPTRLDDWWNDRKGTDLYSAPAMRAAGFEQVDEGQLQRGDLILMQIHARNDVPNHAGVYLGDGLFLHHLYNRLSTKAVYGGYWREKTRSFWRWSGPHESATP